MRFVFKETQPPRPDSALIQPILSPSCPWEGAPWERARPSPLHPMCPRWESRAGVCGRKLRDVRSYQVRRGSLGLRSVIIHVQIDQDFSCSPYSAGHFPYRQLPKSRSRGDRDKGKASEHREGKHRQAGCGRGLHTHMQRAPNRQTQPGVGSRQSGDVAKAGNRTL